MPPTKKPKNDIDWRASKFKASPIKKPKTEEDESWVKTSSYVYASKGLFPISVLKAAERKKERAKSKQVKEEHLYLDQHKLVPYPFAVAPLLELKDNCSYFDDCVKQIAVDVMGQGWKLILNEGKKESEKDRERIEKFIENTGVDRDETFEQTLERGILDWGYIGWWGWEIARNKKNEVDAMWHVPAHTFHVHEDHDKYRQKRNNRNVWFKRFGLEGNISAKTGKDIPEEKKDDEEKEKIEIANELIYYRNYYPQSDYYGAPNILPAVGSVIGFVGVRDYNLAFFDNYGIPAALVILEGRWSKDSAKQISDFLDVEIKSSENAHKTMIIHPSKDSKLTWQPLSVEMKEGSFSVYQQELIDEILASYKMHPYRIGKIEEGSLGGSVAEESTKIYVDSVIKPLEKIVNDLVTKKLIQQGLKIETYRFELNTLDLRNLDAEVDRYVKLFGVGAMTPNQIIQLLGGKPYPEGNKYYVAQTYIEAGEEEPEEVRKLNVEEIEKAMKELEKYKV